MKNISMALQFDSDLRRNTIRRDTIRPDITRLDTIHQDTITVDSAADLHAEMAHQSLLAIASKWIADGIPVSRKRFLLCRIADRNSISF